MEVRYGMDTLLCGMVWVLCFHSVEDVSGRLSQPSGGARLRNEALFSAAER